MPTLKGLFTDIADAIREKDESTDKIIATDFPEKIKSIPSGNNILQTLMDNYKSQGYWFYSNNSINDWTFLNSLDLSKLTSGYLMFGYASNNVSETTMDEEKNHINCTFLNMTDTENMFVSSGFTHITLDIPSGTSLYRSFYSCVNLKECNLINTNNITSTESTFYNCKWNLTETPVFDTNNVQQMTSMFDNCISLTTAKLFDTSKVFSFNRVFYNCKKLKNIPAYNLSNAITLYDAFFNCSSLETFDAYGMKVSFNLSSSTKWTAEEIVKIFGNLATVTTTQTLTLGETNLAKLTEDQKKIAQDKGWELV